MSETKGKFRWAVGILVALIAAGGGGTAWLKYFDSKSKPVDPINPWTQAQSLYFESFDLQYENPDLWPIDQQGFWLRELKNGAYCFTNQAGEGEVDFHYLEVQGMDNSELPVAVDIHNKDLAGSKQHSGAGLLYRYDKERRFYYAITLTPVGQLRVYKRNDNGYNTLYSGPAESHQKEDFNRLAVVGSGAELHIYINDALSRVVKDDELRHGISGMIGVGIGSFCFDNYAIYESMKELPE
jgi:hypothetical protein